MEQIKELASMSWTEADFGQSKMKADYKKQLHGVIMLDSLNNVHHKGLTTFIPDSQVSYLAESGGKQYKFISGDLKIKPDKQNQEKLDIRIATVFPPFAKLVVDYLLGRYTFFNEQLYDVNDRQAKPIDDFAIQELYGFRKETRFILEILSGISKRLNIKPVRQLAPYKIAGIDFVLDLETHHLTRTIPDPDTSFFKFYQVDFNTAKENQKIATRFLNQVIADKDSLHNALLQTYYMAQVASGLLAKQNFFISKSGVRTGKGLRHIALSGLFNKIDVELDGLIGSNFEAQNAWSLFSGGEMALATEQGDIMGDKMERVLKIIATEKTHVARSIQSNSTYVKLTAVLCIDTNRNVALSDEMNGRKVNIQYKDRPKGETDLERQQFFSEYWQTFTHLDKSPKIEGTIGFLFASLEYFHQVDKKFEWQDVEVFNDVDLDDFQLHLINALKYTDFVERDDHIIQLQKEVYGKSKIAIGNALRTIGVKKHRAYAQGGKKIAGYIVDNQKRFNSFAGNDFIKSDDRQAELRLAEVFGNL